MRPNPNDPPTREQMYSPAHDARAEREAQAQYAARERQHAHDERRRALATLDTADVLWRLVRIAVYTIVGIIALSIIFHLLSANHNNSFVSTINDWADTLAGPFAGMFVFHSAKATIGLDYGIAIVVYVLVAELIINLIGAAIVPARRRAAGVTADSDPRYPPPSQYPQYK